MTAVRAYPPKAEPVFRTGIVAECKLATVLGQLGYRTALLKHGSRVAPALQSWRGRVPLPHWQVRWPDGGTDLGGGELQDHLGAMEALGGLRTTGLDRPDYKDLAEAEQLTGRPVRVVFAHRTQNAVVVAGLRERASGRKAPAGAWCSGTSTGCPGSARTGRLRRRRRLGSSASTSRCSCPGTCPHADRPVRRVGLMATAMVPFVREDFDRLAAGIRWHDEQAQQAWQSALRHKWEMGVRLLQAKRGLPKVSSWPGPPGPGTARSGRAGLECMCPGTCDWGWQM